jgi:hypothetical protein
MEMSERDDGDKCPKCGGNSVVYGYGLMGGGCGPYEICTTEGCDYFHKQDPEIGDHDEVEGMT